ncbi:12332_t:CDS:2 [Funneliformis mosseae]|uniref:12332_t:CDS:1 n=1 Tax=Funneliformis mosseae TaxID=27381 RepID=A0A9N9HXC8_FUNMO|nr:12332_t:CDS:2 [Funneliformis mosseae]
MTTNSGPGGIVGAIVALDVKTGIYYESGDDNGTLFAIDAKTDVILYEFQTIGTLASGPSIVNGIVYIGNGYEHFRLADMNLQKHEVRPWEDFQSGNFTELSRMIWRKFTQLTIPF